MKILQPQKFCKQSKLCRLAHVKIFFRFSIAICINCVGKNAYLRSFSRYNGTVARQLVETFSNHRENLFFFSQKVH